MALDQNTIAEERDKLRAEIIELEAQVKKRKLVFFELNKLSALLGGDPPTNGNGKLKRKPQPIINKKCTVRGCSRRGHVFTTKAAYNRHFNYEHGETLGGE